MDAGVVIRLVSDEIEVAAEHQLLAPTLLRSQVLSDLHEAMVRGEIPAGVARDRVAGFGSLPIRLLGDGVLRRRAWDVADRLGWASTYVAEYVALTELRPTRSSRWTRTSPAASRGSSQRRRSTRFGSRPREGRASERRGAHRMRRHPPTEEPGHPAHRPGRPVLAGGRHGDLVFLAGHTASNPADGVYEQTREILARSTPTSRPPAATSRSSWRQHLAARHRDLRGDEPGVGRVGRPGQQARPCDGRGAARVDRLQGRDRRHRRPLRSRGGRPGSLTCVRIRPSCDGRRVVDGVSSVIDRITAACAGLAGSLNRSSARAWPIAVSEAERPGEPPRVHLQVRTLDEAFHDVKRDVDGADARTVRPAQRDPGDRDAHGRQVIPVGRHDDDHVPAVRHRRMACAGSDARRERQRAPPTPPDFDVAGPAAAAAIRRRQRDGLPAWLPTNRPTRPWPLPWRPRKRSRQCGSPAACVMRGSVDLADRAARSSTVHSSTGLADASSRPAWPASVAGAFVGASVNACVSIVASFIPVEIDGGSLWRRGSRYWGGAPSPSVDGDRTGRPAPPAPPASGGRAWRARSRRDARPSCATGTGATRSRGSWRQAPTRSATSRSRADSAPIPPSVEAVGPRRHGRCPIDRSH